MAAILSEANELSPFNTLLSTLHDDAKLLLKRQNKQASLKLGPQQLQKLLIDGSSHPSNRRSLSTDSDFDEFDVLDKGSRLSLEEFDSLDSLKFADADTRVDKKAEEDSYFDFKSNRFAQAKSFFWKESEEMYLLRQSVADLKVYIDNFKEEIKKLNIMSRKRLQKLEELKKYTENRQAKLMRYGFDKKLRLPYFLAGKLNIKIAELRIQILEESKRVLQTRISDAEALKSTTKLKIANIPTARKNRKSWSGLKRFFNSPKTTSEKAPGEVTSPGNKDNNNCKETDDTVDENTNDKDKEGLTNQDSKHSTPIKQGENNDKHVKLNYQTPEEKDNAARRRASSYSPVDNTFFKRSLTLTVSDPIITQLREELSTMIYRIQNVLNVCKKTLSRHLKSMKTREREIELKKTLKIYAQINEQKDQQNNLEKNTKADSSSSRFSISLEDENGVTVLFAPTAQSFFDSVVGDQRTREGRLLERLKGKLEKAYADAGNGNDTIETKSLIYKYLPCAVNNFSSYLVQLVAARYHISDGTDQIDNSKHNEMAKRLSKSLSMMTRNMVFTKLYDVCISYNAKVINQKDQLWREKTRKLKTKTQEEMHIDNKFQINIAPDTGNVNDKHSKSQNATQRPYNLSIQCIEKLNDCKTPDEMTQILLDSIKIIHNEAREATGAKIGGMDDLLPILVYVLVQSNLPCINRILAYMENFATNINNGEASFYMCCLQAGVNWTLNNGEDDNEEKTAQANQPITLYFTSKQEALVDEELQQWMIGVDMIEDSYDMLL